MRPRFVIALAVATVLGSGGCSSSEDSSAPESDEATQQSLQQAYGALEAAAEDVPSARLPRLGNGEVVVVGKGETHKTSPPEDLGLVEYLGERGIAFGLALIEDESERGIALNGIEFSNATDSITLIIQKKLRYGTARELLAGGATFAAISPSGEIYCINDAEIGVEQCPAPEAPLGTSDLPNHLNRDEPLIPRDAKLCGDQEKDGEFIALRLFAKDVACREAIAVVEGGAEGAPPEGWSCSAGPGTFVECRNGRSLIGFNK